MAMDAGQHVAARFGGQHLMDKIAMTRNTSVLSDAAVAGFDLDRLVEVLERECERMEEAVVGLGYPFTKKFVRQMAVVANGNMAMAGVLPRVVMIVHHVAVRASLWVIAEIAGALAIAKRKDADTAQHTQQQGENNRKRTNGADQTGPGACRGSRSARRCRLGWCHAGQFSCGIVVYDRSTTVRVLSFSLCISS